MKHPSTPKAAVRMARVAGLIYLLIAAFGAFAIAYVPSQIIVAGDAQATFDQLQDRAGLFRAGMFADVFVIIAEIVLTAILYVLLRPVDQVRSMIAAMARYAMVLVMAVNLMINVTAFMMSNGQLTGSPDTVLALFSIHAMGVYVWGILFGVHLWFLGSLVGQSGYLPRTLGGLMFIGAFGCVFEGLTKVTALEITGLSWVVIGLLSIVTFAELAFAFWLLVRGLNVSRWEAVRA
ncbi:MAG TPA: DUF4386 domain-containing protein [Rhodobacteraceae bacterium]|nr:DUF4386 domain-containing protein [Paracoccaceae bacterium]